MTIQNEFLLSEDILSAPLLVAYFSSAVRGHHRPPPSKGRTKQITISTAAATVQPKPAIQRSTPSNPSTPGPAPRPLTPAHTPTYTPPPPTRSYVPQQPPLSPEKSQVIPVPSSPHRRKLANSLICM